MADSDRLPGLHRRQQRRGAVTHLISYPMLALLLATTQACTPAEAPSEPTTKPDPFLLIVPEGAEQAAEVITAELLRAPIAELGNDSYEGRGPGSAGDAKTRHYLIQELQALGLEPGGSDGSWEQSFQLVGIDTTAPDTWSFSSTDGKTIDLAFWDEFIAGSGIQQERSVISDSELVFVGYGIEAPEYGWDDFQGTDLSGKTLVILNNDPDWDPELFQGDRRLYYGRWTYKYESAARQGAAGAIIIHTTPSAGYPFQVVQTSWTGEQFQLPAGDEPRVPVEAWVSWDAAGKLMQAAGHDLEQLIESAKSPDFAPVPLGLTTSLELVNKINPGAETANVLGLLPGSDPELAEEVVIFTAHHDHLGIGKADDTGDGIYNGALDNAAGTATVLAIAKAFSELPQAPRRSILFAFVAAEEQGLLGSKHYSAHPSVHPGRLAANLNFDGANIWGRTRDLPFIGYGKSSLDAVVEAVAARQDRTVVGDQHPDRGYFYRSDQFNLAKIGVPAIYFDGGVDFRDDPDGSVLATMERWTEIDYHQPSDELEDHWVWDGVIEDTRAGFFAGLHIANADQMPTWNQGDEFEAARLAALADVAE